MIKPIEAIKELGEVGSDLRRFARIEKRLLKKETPPPKGKSFEQILEAKIEEGKRRLNKLEKDIIEG